ncbi:MAG: LysE family translocator [Proteobacteria bacterium]|nr:MAG: LysE family translocator [Pseudomonadota bacterium]QKK11538.1 MAG: LysE family translocator [Pseudomonadota bacterium]
MSALSVLGLAGAMFLLAVTPGPGVFATVARALASGFGHATVVVLGIVSGDLLFLLLAIFGLAALAEVLGGLFAVVKYVGAGYLIWLGLRLWMTTPESTELKGVRELSWKANFFSGLVITLGNPKVILFYLGFLPTFLDLTRLEAMDIVVVATVVSVVLGAVLLGYAYAAGRARKLFASPRAKRTLNRSAGSVMIVTGAVLATR